MTRKAKAPCTNCGTVHASNLAMAVGRFSGRTTYFSSVGNFPSRDTREAANEDACNYLKEISTN